MKKLKVNYKTYSDFSTIKRVLNELTKYPLLSFDLEVRSIYNKAIRDKAKENLKEDTSFHMVANSSGLSHPSLTKVTHIIFGISKTESIIFVTKTDSMVKYIFNHMLTMQNTTKFIIHNSQFDLKVFQFTIKKILTNYIDTQLLALTLINDTNDYKRKTGLKHLMGDYYNSAWTEDTDYEVEDLFNKAFLTYAAIDGASTMYLYEQLQETIKEE
jgi:hypothetical protein